ncbi:MAG TPA: response regulator [Holophagaceae bacterium]|nr:response regulator [Holophagaceae bacterium]HJW33072.1 response regulator [Holophagaceae bacterium]
MAKIAVVDDAKLMRTILMAALEQAGHEVVVLEPLAASEVGDILQQHAPDLLLTDFNMPGANGATVIRMARRVLPELPVVVVTAFGDAETTALLKKLNVGAVLRKPVRPEDVKVAVAAALRVIEPPSLD